MLIAGATDRRSPKSVRIDCDLAIAGGGLAGTCCAITAARAGIKVTLIQDRPLLGGNASSEVRLWILGATSHMGNNNRWAREGGNPFDDAKWDEAWKTNVVNAAEWDEIRSGLRDEAHDWLRALKSPRDVSEKELTGMASSVAHLAYHFGAIRQINKAARGPKEGTF